MPNTPVKEAIRLAKDFVRDVLADEDPVNIGLEELEYSDADHAWLITVGFSRPWNTSRGTLSTITGERASNRAYRVVKIDDTNGQATSMMRREVVD